MHNPNVAQIFNKFRMKDLIPLFWFLFDISIIENSSSYLSSSFIHFITRHLHNVIFLSCNFFTMLRSKSLIFHALLWCKKNTKKVLSYIFPHLLSITYFYTPFQLSIFSFVIYLAHFVCINKFELIHL